MYMQGDGSKYEKFKRIILPEKVCLFSVSMVHERLEFIASQNYLPKTEPT